MLGRRSLVGGAALFASLGLAACATEPAPQAVTTTAVSTPQTTAAPQGADDATLTLSVPAVAALDPAFVLSDAECALSYQLFDTLTDYDYERGKLVGLAASSWDVNGRGDEIVFHLVHGASFHNGDPVTSESFKASWERLVASLNSDAPSPNAYRLSGVDGFDEFVAGEEARMRGLECPDEETLRVRLSAPDVDFPSLVAHPSLAPLPEGEGTGTRTAYYASHPIGNGPFRLVQDWDGTSALELEPFADYHSGAPRLSKLCLLPQTAAEGYKALEAGTVDFASVPVDRMSEAKLKLKQPKSGYTLSSEERLLLGEALRCCYLACNLSDAQLGSVHLRHALSLALNRQAICDDALGGTGEPADGIVPPVCPGYEAGSWSNVRYDVAAATAILDQYWPAGQDGTRPLSLTLAHESDEDSTQVARLVAEYLDRVGVKLTLAPLSGHDLRSALAQGSYQLALTVLAPTTPDLDAVLYPLFFGGSGATGTLGYNEEPVNKLLSEARACGDEQERLTLYQQVNRMVGLDMPVLPLVYDRLHVACSERVASLAIDPVGRQHCAKAQLKA